MLFLAVMTAGYGVYAADRTVLASVLVPLSASLGLSNVEQGLLASSQYMGVLSAVFVAGHLSDRYGKMRIVLLGVAVFSLFTWLVGTSADFYQAFAFRFVSGLGEGIFWPVAMSAVANYFGASKGLALGAFYVGFDAGGAGGTGIGGLTYSLTSDWRTAFFVAPLLGIAVVAGLFVARGAFADAESKAGALSVGRDALALLRNRQVAVLMAFAFVATYPIAAWQNFLPKYLSTVFGVTVPFAAYGYGAVLVSGGAGKLLIGRASDSRPRNRVLSIVSLAVLGLFAVFFLATHDPYVALLVGVAVGFPSAAIFPVMQALATDSCGGKTGTALGLTTTFQSAATVLAPTITSLFFPQGVGTAVYLNVMVPMVAVVAVSFLLSEPRGASGLRGNYRLNRKEGA